MKLRVAKKVLRKDAVRARMMYSVRSSAAHMWLMNEIFGQYRQATIDRAVNRFCKWANSQAKWAIEHWDEIKTEPVPESAIRRLREMIARAKPTTASRED